MITEGQWDSFLWVDESGSGTFTTGERIAKITGVTDISAGGNQSIATETEIDALVSAGSLII